MPKSKALLAGERFGLLTAVSEVGRSSRGAILWLFKCECGREHITRATSARLGKTGSCGCLYGRPGANSERRGEKYKGEENPNFKHGRFGSDVYTIWAGMLNRCKNASNPGFKNYGGRGISVCQRWQDSFENFLTDMGPRPSSRHTVERIDNDGNYAPDNCRWATYTEQARNRRNNAKVTIGGRTVTVAQAAEEAGMGVRKLRKRINSGVDPELAVSIRHRPRRWTKVFRPPE